MKSGPAFHVRGESITAVWICGGGEILELLT